MPLARKSLSLPSATPLRLAPGLDAPTAIQRVQDLFLTGRDINALYICSDRDLEVGRQRKAAWVRQASGVLGLLDADGRADELFGDVSLDAIADADADIHALAEAFHHEMGQRLERLRILRKMLEQQMPPGSAGAPATPVAPLIREGSPPQRPCASLANGAGKPTPRPMPRPVPDPAPQAAGALSGLSSRAPSPPARPASQAAGKPVPAAAASERLKLLLVLTGRSQNVRPALLRYAGLLGLEFVVTQLDPHRPHTLLDRLHEQRDTGFALICLAGDLDARDSLQDAASHRILGYAVGLLVGRLGRNRVALLTTAGAVDAPGFLPGYQRLVCLPLDSRGNWQFQLTRRMRQLQLPVDLNRLT